MDTLLKYDFEKILVDLITSCPMTSWVSYKLTCTQCNYSVSEWWGILQVGRTFQF